MKPEAFGRALERARKRADTHQAAFQSIYREILTRAAASAARKLVTQAALTASDWQPPPEGTLTAGLGVTVALREQQAMTVQAVVKKPLERAGIAWDVNDPLLQAFLQQTEAWSGLSIEEAFLPELNEIVSEAFTQGLSVRDAAALIRARFAETSVWQAEMLARSNLNMLGNGGMQVAVTRYNERASAAGDELVETKTWVTAGDSAVRASHVAAAGQTVPVDQSFQVGGSMLSFPGDPGGALAEVLNCRCVALYGTSARRNLVAAVPSPAMANLRTKAKRRRRARDGALTAAEVPRVQWVSDLAFEGDATSDGRYMMPNSIEWRDLPLTLMAMTVTDEGHDGAFVSGRIDKISRASTDIDGEKLPEGVTSIRGGGVFDVNTESREDVVRLVADETLRGVSVDLAVIDWAFRDPKTGEIIQPTEATEDEMERAFFGELQFAVRRAELLAATICPTPAFANAKIALAASGMHIVRFTSDFEIVDEALIASVAPDNPPRDWFFKKEPPRVTPMEVTDEGQIWGHVAQDVCHTGHTPHGVCVLPPSSPSGYAYFNSGKIRCSDGSRVECGQITIGTDHAPIASNWREAKAHYENTGRCVADVRAVDGEHGIFVAGALRSNVTDAQRRELMGAKASGHWCQVEPGGPMEMIGILEVNIPGFPIPRPQLAIAASALHPEGEPIALIAAGIVGADDWDIRLQVHEARLDGRAGLAKLIG